jgi:hypothetical protein
MAWQSISAYSLAKSTFTAWLEKKFGGAESDYQVKVRTTRPSN